MDQLIFPAGTSLGNTLGALQVGLPLAIFMFGILTLQVYYYFENYQADSLCIRSAVSTSTSEVMEDVLDSEFTCTGSHNLVRLAHLNDQYWYTNDIYLRVLELLDVTVLIATLYRLSVTLFRQSSEELGEPTFLTSKFPWFLITALMISGSLNTSIQVGFQQPTRTDSRLTITHSFFSPIKYTA